jgi:hypothetical protein
MSKTADISKQAGGLDLRPIVLAWLAISGGRSDRLRIVLTAIGSGAATIALLTAAAVAFIREGDGPYRLEVLNQPGLRPGVIIAMALLCIPILNFVGQCSRVGAPARDRRLAMLRMAGASPPQVSRIAAIESGLAATLGSVVGAFVFVVARPQLGFAANAWLPTSTEIVMPNGQIGYYIDEVFVRTLLLPVDSAIPVAAVIAIVGVLGLGSTLFSLFALRKVIVSPFGVVRSSVPTVPTATPVLLVAGGTGGLIALGIVNRLIDGSGPAIAAMGLVLVVVCATGLIIGGASIASVVGQYLAQRVSKPSLLIASRRMLAAPFTASRATTSVVLAVLIGSIVQGLRENFLLQYADPDDPFYADTFRLVGFVLIVAIVLASASLLVVNAEAIVERRRTLAMLVASGTPRGVLARASLAEVVVPLVPTVLVAAAAGTLAARGLTGQTATRFVEGGGPNEIETIRVPIAWVELATLTGGTVGVCIAVTAISLVFLRSSTTPSEFRRAA